MNLITGSLQNYLSSTEELIEEARAGRVFILVDDEDRENEGDLVVPAQFATPDVINFMARHARGLICLALTGSRVEELGLPLMSHSNRSRHGTAFTVSIEARDGITTGISTRDRAHTVAVAINPEIGRDDVVSPGHVFPLVARDGGTLVRAGHTEAAVDIARLAGLNPSGVICEVMSEDGSMARLPGLISFAQHHNLKVGTIADLIAHRRRTERLVSLREQGTLDHAVGGTWRIMVYVSRVDGSEHMALVKGEVDRETPLLVRMHTVNILMDTLGCAPLLALHGAMETIAAAGRGVVVLIRDTRLDAISAKVKTLNASEAPEPALRDYGIGAQILVELGVKRMILLSNTPRTVVGLDGYGLEVVDQLPIDNVAAD